MRSKNAWLATEGKIFGQWGSMLRFWLSNPVSESKNPRCWRGSFDLRAPWIERRWGTGFYLHSTEQTRMALDAIRRGMDQVSEESSLRIATVFVPDEDEQNWWYPRLLAISATPVSAQKTEGYLRMTREFGKDPRSLSNLRVLEFESSETRHAGTTQNGRAETRSQRLVSTGFFTESQWALVTSALRSVAEYAALVDAGRPRQ